MRIERDQIRNLGIVAGLLVALGAGVWVPAHASRSDLHERIEKAKRELGLDGAGAEELRRLNSDVLNLRDLTSQSQRYVPSEDELAEVLRALTESMATFGVTVHEVIVSDPQHFRDYSLIPVKIEFSGTFPAAYGVLRQIESMPRLLRVDDLQMDGARGGNGVSVMVQLSTFFSPQDTEGSGG